MGKFFGSKINNKCSYFHDGCTHKKSTQGNLCEEDYCPLLLEAGLVDPEQVERTNFIVALYAELDAGIGSGFDTFSAVVNKILKGGYKIVKIVKLTK
jgi:hypothetical protein